MKQRFSGIALPLLTAFIWGTAFVAQDICADSIPPMTFNALRFAVAVLFLGIVKLILSAVRRSRPAAEAVQTQKPGSIRKLILAGVLCGTALAVASNLQQAGMEAGLDAGKSGFITALYVVLVPIGATLMGKRLRPIFWAGLALAVAGLYLLCVNGNLRLAPADLLTLGCALAFAVQILLIDRFAGELDSISFCIAEFAAAAILSLAGMLIFERPSWPAVWEYILPLLYVAVFSCGVAYLLQIIAQKRGDPAIVSLLFSMEAVFSVIAGAVILHQRMTLREYAGCALILLAVIIAQLPGKKTE